MALDSTLIDAIARLETRGGAASIKGPNGEDSYNLFNIKDFSGGGFQAHDAAEGSNDRYRTYANAQESRDDFVRLLQRRYPKAYAALQSGNEVDFANGLKEGGYATDPAYVSKVLANVESVRKGAGRAPSAPTPTPQVNINDLDEAGLELLAAKPKDFSALKAQMAVAGNLDAQDAGRASVDPQAPFRAEAEREKEAVLAQNTGIADAFRTAVGDLRVMSYPLLDKLTGESDLGQRDPNYSWSAVRAQMTEGMSDDERAYMDEWGVKGKQYAERAAAQVQMMRDQNRVYERAGGLNTFLASLGAGAVDAPSMGVGLFTMGIGKMAGIAKAGFAGYRSATIAEDSFGAYQLAARAARMGPGMGPKTAVAAAVAENVGGQLFVDALNDAAGRTTTAEDYMMGVAGAGILSALHARGTYRAAMEAHIQSRAADIAAEVARTSRDRVAEPPELTAARQVQEIREDFNRQPTNTDVLIPHDLQEQIRQEVTGDPPKVEPVVTTPEVPTTEKVPDPHLEPLPDLKLVEEDKLPVPETKEVSFEFPEIEDHRLVDFPAKTDALIADLQKDHKGGYYLDTEARINALMGEDGFNPHKLTTEQSNAIDRLLAEAQHVEADGKPRDLSKPHFIGTSDGKPVKLSMRSTNDYQVAGLKEGVKTHREVTLREFLEAYRDNANKHDTGQSRLAAYLLKKLDGDGVLDQGRVFLKKTEHERGQATFTGHMRTPGGHELSKPVKDIVNGLNSWAFRTGMHEAVHVVTLAQLNLALKDPHKASPAVRAATRTVTDVLERFRKQNHLDGIKSETRGRAYAAKNEYELVAMFFDDPEVQRTLAKMPASPSFGGRLSTAWHELMDAIKTILGIDKSGDPTAHTELSWAIDVLLDKRGGGLTYSDGVPVAGWPGVSKGAQTAALGPLPPSAGGTNPLQTFKNKRAFAARMLQAAEVFMAKNPINERALKTLTARAGMQSDGLVLAASKNPIIQMFASLVTETTTGAAGRRQSVAIRKTLLEQKMLGNLVLEHEAAFNDWRVRNNIPWFDDLTRGEGRLKWNDALYDEIVNRRNNQPLTNDPAIKAAADSMQAFYERALGEQKRAKTLGSDHLPDNSVGYVPQALDGRKLANATDQQIAELSQHLADHWQRALQWDAKFSKEFADYYINRARARAMNTKGIELAADASDSVHTIRDTLTAMEDAATDPAQVSAILKAKAAVSEKGLGQTRARLDVGLHETLPSGARVRDFYDTNVLALARRYNTRTAGTVAFTEAGVHGSVGVRYLRDAITETAKEHPVTAQELESFDRIASELLGQPIAGEVVSRHAAGLRLLTGLVRLGSMGFTQLGETVGMVRALGIGATLKGIAEVPRLMGEVGRIKRGAPAGNHLLTDIETWGGPIGAQHYHMVMPLDPPDGRVGTYAENPNLIERLLRSGSHLQSKVSFFRGIMAVQHRMVAEQIVMKAARYIRDGGNSVALRDMGFTDELVNALRQDIHAIAQWDANDKLQAFNITKTANPATAEAFVHAVHRGVGQIIQETFVGEKSKWMHNDYLKLLGQLRTFGITATEKQWARTVVMHGAGARGYAYATGLLVAESALVLPMHLARVQYQAMGREDRDKFIADNLAPGALVRSVMNYGSLSGITGDFLDVLTGVAGGWSWDVKELVGGRKSMGTVSDAIPALGVLDNASKVVTGHSNLYNAFKTLPGSNVPFVIPLINTLRKDQ